MTRNDLFEVSLKALVGKSEALDIVLSPGNRDTPTIEAALAEVKRQLCPFPAVRICDWFWTTNAGQTICRTEWYIYHLEFVRPSQAARILWGRSKVKDIERLNKLVKKKKLTLYWMPREAAEKIKDRKPDEWPTYFRRHEVLALRKQGGYLGQSELFKKRYSTPVQLPEYREDHREALGESG